MRLKDFTCNNTKVSDLTPLQGMALNTLILTDCPKVVDVTPLQGMPLTSLTLYGCGQVRDLTPLKNMKLTTLNLNQCGQVSYLTPLQGMNLQYILFNAKNVTRGMEYLRQMKSLTNLNDLPPAEFDVSSAYERFLFHGEDLQGIEAIHGIGEHSIVVDCRSVQSAPIPVAPLPIATAGPKAKTTLTVGGGLFMLFLVAGVFWFLSQRSSARTPEAKSGNARMQRACSSMTAPVATVSGVAT
jgi:hypothetical protein